ncbi:MAG: hypothetical protein HEP71_10370 [Roseivirga sp.]|nr:hypothetical protein [Roseivirga sp.]
MVKTSKANIEKQKFKRFYLFGAVLWCLSITLFYLSASWVASPNLTEGVKTFAKNIRGIILVFIVFGIPIIFLLSFIIRLAEPVMDKIKERIDAKK